MIINRREKTLSIPVQEQLLSQFSQLLSQGYSFNQTLSIAASSNQGRKLEAVKQLEYLISNGASLAEAFQRASFSADLPPMIAQAEIHGNLAQTLAKASEWKRRQMRFSTEIKKAISYPLFLIVLIGLVSYLLLQFVIPQFIFLYDSYDLTLPISTQMILTGSSILVRHAPWIMILILLFGMAVLICYHRESWRQRLMRGLFYVPGVNSLMKTLFTISFCTQLGYLLHAHVSLFTALNEMKLGGSTLLSQRAGYIAQQLTEGHPFSSVLKEEKWFVPELAAVVFYAEKNGRLAQQMIEYSHYLESSLLEKWLTKIKWIEPLLLVLLGLLTATLFITLFLPVFQLLDLL